MQTNQNKIEYVWKIHKSVMVVAQVYYDNVKNN